MAQQCQAAHAHPSDVEMAIQGGTAVADRLSMKRGGDCWQTWPWSHLCPDLRLGEGAWCSHDSFLGLYILPGKDVDIG